MVLGFFKSKKQNNGMVGISDTDQGLAFAHIIATQEGPRLSSCDLFSADADRQKLQDLVGKLAEFDLLGTPCNYVLSETDYNLLLVEAPKVEADEMSAAVRWRVKDLIDRPIEEVAIDIFPVPDDAYRSQGDMIYVVVSRKSRIIEIRDTVAKTGLQLVAIDIPELAMRNLSNIHTDDSNGLAFIDLRATGSTLNLCRNGSIYLTRHLNTRVDQEILESADWDAVKERLVLEIQRSLDYYESQMGQSPISRLLLAPRSRDSKALAKELDDAMGVSVETMDLTSHLPAEMELSAAMQQSNLLAIGGALRQEGVAA